MQAGTYSGLVKDANGCTKSTSFVVASAMDAVNDSFTVINTAGTIAITSSVLNNDTLYGNAVVSSQVIVTMLQLPAGFTVSSAGTILVSNTVASGTYSFNYSVCDNLLSFANCDSAQITIIVNAAVTDRKSVV